MDIFIVWKALSSIQNISKQYLQLYFDQKKRKVRFQIFNLNYGLSPLEKSPIWRLCKIDIFRVWKAFPSIQNIIKQCFKLYFDQKQRKTKFQFFDLNLRLSPLEKSLIWRLCKMDIPRSLESLSFYLEHQQTIFLGLFCLKTSKDQISIFQLNSWVNRFRKITTMVTLQNGHSSQSGKPFFLCRTSANNISRSILIKKNKKQRKIKF